MKKSRKVMIDAMKHELETNFREEYAAGKVYLMAASSSTDEVTEEWVNQIKESFPGMEVMCDKLSFGLSCHIGPMDWESDAPVSQCKKLLRRR